MVPDGRRGARNWQHCAISAGGAFSRDSVIITLTSQPSVFLESEVLWAVGSEEQVDEQKAEKGIA